jgi:peptidoglycan/LPS O-acetylase OafA/YrhL
LPAVWEPLAASETQNANFTARILVLAIFAGLAWLVGYAARRRKHPHAWPITILGWALVLGLVGYILTVRPVARWSIWLIAGLGYGILLVWAYAGGSEPKSD